MSVSTREMLQSPAESSPASIVYRAGIPPTEFPLVSLTVEFSSFILL